MKNIKFIAFGVAAWSILGCGSGKLTYNNGVEASLPCPWEFDVYSTALSIITNDSASIREYEVTGGELKVKVWDTAADFSNIRYDDMDFTPETCMPDKFNTTYVDSSSPIPCKSHSVVGLGILSNSTDPNFLVKFGDIDSSFGGGGYLVKAFVNPLNNGRIVTGKSRDIYDMRSYVFCFDRRGKVQGFKRSVLTE